MIKQNITFKILILFLSTLFSNIAYSNGGISLSQTRIVFDSNMKNAKLSINNQSDRVYLINSRIYDNNSLEKNNITDSFLITPPLFRLENNTQNTLMITPNNLSTLPLDRESVFYLSILAIPSTKKSDEQQETLLSSKVSVGIRMWIKLFYRPDNLNSSLSNEFGNLLFSNENNRLVIKNPTPYYITIAKLDINEKPINIREQGAMIAPFSSNNYVYSEKINKVSWSAINEHGGLTKTYKKEYNND
ncbi:molecular chaperone [Providencia rettgeri]|uniref:fimbrial biogenesis chaperone n=1 Tax=Providencia TaxID=586 RepID=UPI0018E49928|nr:MULTISPECIES: molecular chaperone [Providencia]MBI6194745.1 molecular chaperone [Providencia rettgeri]MCX9125481.1 molecular chaperone [Providencia rettgeri]MCX9130086.1 molecular chaperone [Providencia rettgeri]HCT9039607.1 molecular chaperone [Providencia rettgeri]